MRRTIASVSILIVLFASAMLTAPESVAQPTNMRVLEELAVECIRELTLPGDVVVAPDVRYDGIAFAVMDGLRAAGTRIFEADTSATSRPVLTYHIDRVGIRYARAQRDYDRVASLSMAMRLTQVDGEIVQTTRCDREATHRIARRHIHEMEAGAMPEATAALPPASLRRRVIEPALLAGATAVSVVLFFTLRSKRSTSE